MSKSNRTTLFVQRALIKLECSQSSISISISFSYYSSIIERGKASRENWVPAQSQEGAGGGRGEGGEVYRDVMRQSIIKLPLSVAPRAHVRDDI